MHQNDSLLIKKPLQLKIRPTSLIDQDLITVSTIKQETQAMAAIRCRKTTDLSGTVKISGSKNVGLKLLTITPMFYQSVFLRGVPKNNQVSYLLTLLESFGLTVAIEAETSSGMDVKVHAATVSRNSFNYQEVRWCRHMFLLAISILIRTGRVDVPLPGYSHYGPRPIDGQLNGLRKMGVIVHPINNGMLHMELPDDGLKGADIYLAFPSNAMTEALLWAAVGARGTTTIHGAAQEPETIEIEKFFQEAGVDIVGIGTPTVSIHSSGLDVLSSPSSFTIMPDRIEASTFGAAVTICGGEVRLDGCRNAHLGAVRATLLDLGTEVVVESDRTLLLRGKGRPSPTNISTGPYPCFPTDALGPYIAALSTAQGVSVVQERMWPNRLSLAMELKRMGAHIDVFNGQVATIKGVDHLRGAPVIGTDPRASAALILAGLFAEEETIVTGADLLDNAYDSFVEKLQGLNADVDRVTVPVDIFGHHHPLYGRLEAF